jgi:hypothetical protein
MALLGSITKQPAEVLDFDISYVTVLAGRSDTITNKSVAVSGTDMTGSPVTVSSSTINPGGNSIKVVVAAGVTGKIYKITVTATSNATTPLVYEDEVNVIVEEV